MEETCRHIRAALKNGRRTDEIVAHLERCDACRLASRIDLPQPTTMGRDSARYDDASLRTTTGREILLGASVLALLAVYFLKPRPDLPTLDPTAFAAASSLLVMAIAVLIWALTRPIYKSALGWSQMFAIATLSLVGILAPVVLVESSFIAPVTFAQATFKCFGIGLVLTVPFVLIGLRRIQPTWATTPTVFLFLAAAAFSNAALFLHCPVSDAAHIISAHISLLPMMLMAGFFAAMFVWQRAKR